MNEPFAIREFNPDDIKHVVSINQRCLPENYPDQFFMGLYYHAPKAFFVAEYEGEVVGYIMCRIERGISGFGRMPVKKGHIVSIAVLETLRNNGANISMVKNIEPSLEDVFLHLTGRRVREIVSDGNNQSKRSRHGPRWRRSSRVR